MAQRPMCHPAHRKAPNAQNLPDSGLESAPQQDQPKGDGLTDDTAAVQAKNDSGKSGKASESTSANASAPKASPSKSKKKRAGKNS